MMDKFKAALLAAGIMGLILGVGFFLRPKHHTYIVSIYSNDKHEIHKWVSDGHVQLNNGITKFTDKLTGTEVKTSGGIVIIELFGEP